MCFLSWPPSTLQFLLKLGLCSSPSSSQDTVALAPRGSHPGTSQPRSASCRATFPNPQLRGHPGRLSPGCPTVPAAAPAAEAELHLPLPRPPPVPEAGGGRGHFQSSRFLGRQSGERFVRGGPGAARHLPGTAPRPGGLPGPVVDAGHRSGAAPDPAHLSHRSGGTGTPFSPSPVASGHPRPPLTPPPPRPGPPRLRGGRAQLPPAPGPLPGFPSAATARGVPRGPPLTPSPRRRGPPSTWRCRRRRAPRPPRAARHPPRPPPAATPRAPPRPRPHAPRGCARDVTAGSRTPPWRQPEGAEAPPPRGERRYPGAAGGGGAAGDPPQLGTRRRAARCEEAVASRFFVRAFPVPGGGSGPLGPGQPVSGRRRRVPLTPSPPRLLCASSCRHVLCGAGVATLSRLQGHCP